MPSIRPYAILMPLCLLAACTPQDITPTAPFALEGVRLTLEPIPQAECDPTQPYAVRAHWSVADWAEPKFDFHIGSTQGQLWARVNEAEGEHVSDPWVRPGMWFVMLDRESRQMIAATPAPSAASPVSVASSRWLNCTAAMLAVRFFQAGARSR